MPELPDVEAFRRLFERHAVGQRIVRITAPTPVVVRNTTVQGLGRALHHRRFGEPLRHGKWLQAPTDGGGGPTLLLHFAMSGALAWTRLDAERHRHDRAVFVCEDGELRFNQMRLLGGVWLARKRAGIEAITGPLGPDALRLSADQLRAQLEGRRGALKPRLMDQRVVAGLGNLLVDEVLWQARLHPRRPVPELETASLTALHTALQEVLEESVRHGRVPQNPGWLTGVRDREDGCPRCETALERDDVGGRTTVWCPRCQPG